jgi:hypothetical protein
MSDKLNPSGFEGSCRPVPMTPPAAQYTPNTKPAPAYPVPPVYPQPNVARRVSGDVPSGSGK